MVRPFVSVHFAQTLDGRIAWTKARAHLSLAEGVLRAHRARATADAVLVGAETVRIDRPRLTVRAVPAPRQPLRVVLSTGLSLPLGAPLFTDGGGTLVFGTHEGADPAMREALTARGVDVELVRSDADRMASLPAVMEALVSRGVSRLLVEGGAKVLAAFVRARLVDEVEVEICPMILGGAGLSWSGVLDEPPRLSDVLTSVVDGHAFMRARLVY